MFPVYVPDTVTKVHRYYPCTITYTYTTRPTRQGRIDEEDEKRRESYNHTFPPIPPGIAPQISAVCAKIKNIFDPRRRLNLSHGAILRSALGFP